MLTRIIAVVIDTTLLTAYTTDGTAITIPQGDPRVHALLNAMSPIETQGFADVDLTFANPFKDFQEQMGGVIKFFKIAKTTLNGIVSLIEKIEIAATPAPPVAPTSVGSVLKATPPRAYAGDESVPAAPAPIIQQTAVDQIMAHAESVTADSFSADVATSDTVVAVVGDQIIPGTEQLKGHMAHSVKIGSPAGMKAFFERIAKVIKGREHSVEDLLLFMEKNDLPIADDGSLIVYKVLRNAKTGGGYVDCHTQKVRQRLGSFVCVDESMVDKNRRNECSNGLHVARRGYIPNFSGDICTIVKVAPEDVITVPHGDPNKVRVCGYHLIMTLPDEAWTLLKNNTPMTSNPKAQAILGRAISGDHIGIIERVEINGQQGTNVEVTAVDKDGRTIAKKATPAVALDDKTLATPESEKIKPEAIDAIIQDNAKKVAANQSTRQMKAAELFSDFESYSVADLRKRSAQAMLDFKKTSKVSWDKLGIDGHSVARLIEAATQSIVDEPTVEPAVEPEAPLELTKKMESPAPVSSFAPGSRQLEARKLFQDENFAALKELKTRAKISWARLGFYDSEIVIINNS